MAEVSSLSKHSKKSICLFFELVPQMLTCLNCVRHRFFILYYFPRLEVDFPIVWQIIQELVCVVVWTSRNNTAEKVSYMTVIVIYEDMHNNTGCCRNSLKAEQIFFFF